MSAIAERIDLRLSQVPRPRAARLEHLIEKLLDCVEPEAAPQADDEHKRQQALAALNRIAARGGLGLKSEK